MSAATELRKRELMHRRVEEAVASGSTRTEAFHTVGEGLGLRPGHVAAAYWRVQREGGHGTPVEPVAAPDSPGGQLTLGGAA